MTEKVCVACGAALSGRQLKYCADEVCKRERTRWAWILKTYNLTQKQYEAIVEYQGGRCPITGKPLGETSVPHIDHDHSTGYIRGVVTAYANTRLIGRLRSWQTAQNLADYLKDPPAIAAVGAISAPGRTPKKRKRKGKR